MSFPLVVGNLYEFWLDLQNPFRFDPNFVDGRIYKILDIRYDTMTGFIDLIEVDSEHGPVQLTEQEILEHFLPRTSASAFYPYTSEFDDDEPTVVLKCECGAKKVGSAMHSSWCPMYGAHK